MNRSILVRQLPTDAEPVGALVAKSLEISRDMALSAGSGTTFLARALSKKELAALYGVGKDTFRRWLQKAGLHFGTSKILTAAQVEAIVRVLGPPSYLFTV